MVAILLHYIYMSTFAWTLVESLHVYRMLTEARNIDTGPMRFYYVVGWGIPAIVTGEDAQSGVHKNTDFQKTQLCRRAVLLSLPCPAPMLVQPPAEEAPALHTCLHAQGQLQTPGATSSVRCELLESWVQVCSGLFLQHLTDKSSTSVHGRDGGKSK